MTFKDTWPDLDPKLCKIMENMEHNFRDVCDFEFTVERGNLYLLGVRPARRTGIANVRFALSFFAEGKITLSEVFSRITADDIFEFTSPTICDEDALEQVGSGIPASPGTATGQIAITQDKAESFAVGGNHYILVRQEVSPEDVPIMWSSEAVLTTTGGMTSHAAVVCRAWGKPAISGASDWKIDYAKSRVTLADGRVLHEGQWITLNANTGKILRGKSRFNLIHWSDQPELNILNRMQSFALLTNIVQPSICGRFWRIRDYFLHAIPLRDAPSRKRPVAIRKDLDQSSAASKAVSLISKALCTIPPKDVQNVSEIMWGFHRTLSRMLSGALGIGNHDRYCSALWDPAETVTEENGETFLQLVGIEYFDINRYSKNLPDIAHMLLAMEIETSGQGCFLEHTNPTAPSLVTSSFQVVKMYLGINGHAVSLEEIPAIYNVFRKREYRFTWYQEHEIDHDDLLNHIRLSFCDRIGSRHLTHMANALGLMNCDTVTRVGKSFIGEYQWRFNHA
jgi:phosphohistidine swiveling domain-containing protein